jgi:hypothetical protein
VPFGLGRITLLSHFYFSMALLVFTPHLNTRIAYAFQHIFENILSIDIAFTQNQETFASFEDAKISYSEGPLGDEIHFKSHPFILENAIQKIDLAFADVSGKQIPFPVKDSFFNADVFSATFYLLSRYEEYTNKERDRHNRFEGKSSLAYKNGFLYHPVIDEWAFEIASLLKSRFSDFRVTQRRFHFQPTIDIDRPYYYLTDSYFKQKAKKIRYRLDSDPFDVYQQVSDWDLQFGTKTIYFFLMSNQHENDPAPGLDHQLFKDIIKELSENHPVGLHPSYFSSENSAAIRTEKNALFKISERKISMSRQHYLMLMFPKTYRDLIAVGIKQDYTMAFADIPGFRAGTCTPFFWYDLEKEFITDLLVHPVTIMDRTLKKYLGLSPEEAINLLDKLLLNVEKVNGDFISLWHNESISGFGEWKGWKGVYLKLLEKASQNL